MKQRAIVEHKAVEGHSPAVLAACCLLCIFKYIHVKYSTLSVT